ncbi:MAG: DUF805 domain-containing protein [Desulfovibrio sp.]|nr:DUF805 domain-containing protein [Desulfovibrio sp.]
MDFKTAVRLCLTVNYMNFKGRATRSEYWFFVLFMGLIYLVAIPLVEWISIIIPGGLILANIIIFCASLALVLPSVAVQVRRLHDTDWSGWWILASLILIGAIFIFILDCLPGTVGPNRFGPDPLTARQLPEDIKY